MTSDDKIMGLDYLSVYFLFLNTLNVYPMSIPTLYYSSSSCNDLV